MRILYVLIVSVLFVSTAKAAPGQFGINIGGGLPYATQAGLNYMISDKFSAELRYSLLDVEVDTASVTMSLPEVNIKWHPFSGSFFLGLGVGAFSLSVEAVDEVTSQKATADISATAGTVSLGWLWGASNGGFFLGLDLGYQKPFGAEAEIDSALPESNEAYLDAEEAAEEYGELGLPTFTLLRLGYLF